MAAMTCRRSAGVFVTIRCKIPAPKLRPSSVTYTISVNARIPYQISTMISLRSVLNFATDQKEEQQPENHVEADKPNEGKHRAARD